MLFAITIHEAAHGYVARYFGDNTAYVHGPRHAQPDQAHRPDGHDPDAAAAVLRDVRRLPLRLCQAGAGELRRGCAGPSATACGWRSPGPASNFIQAMLWAIVFTVLAGTGVNERFFLEMCKAGVLVNLVMWAFNLFPLPPLDGGRIAGRPAAAAPGLVVQPHRALGLFHRDGAGHRGHRQQLVAAPADRLRLSRAQFPAHAPHRAFRIMTAPVPASSPASPPPARRTWATTSARSARRSQASRRPGTENFYFLADYHALIKCDEPARVQRSTLEIAACWLACGLDPEHGVLLPPVGHPRDPGTDLAAHLRHRQGPAQSRACLQGGGRQEHAPPAWTPTPASPRACSCTRC